MSAEQLPARIDLLKAAFGDAASKFEENLNEAAKVHFEAYKFKLERQKPVYKARAELASKVPQFWYNSLQNCGPMAQFIDPVDEDALKHLKEVSIEHGEDVREFEVKFTFGKNPYFKESVLSKKLTLTAPSSVTPKPEPAAPYDLEATTYLASATPISWTSADHDLTKKAPRSLATDKEEFDEFEGPGSFFNWFKEEGEDITTMGESLLEWYGHATEYAAGLAAVDDDSDDQGFDFDDDFDESEDEDPKKEIDLSDEEKRPKKKQRK
ncbi:Protein SET [Rhodotorula toruloides]|nr:Protein SET [Rhodotorula toruloides]